MTPLVILQARMSSKRFPGKVLQDLFGKPMIIRQISRIQSAKNIGKIVVATTRREDDDLLVSTLLENEIDIYRGATDDVISRYVQVIRKFQANTVVRLTADCPLVMPELLDSMIEDFSRNNWDYLSNTIFPTYPDGLDIEIFSAKSLISLYSMKLTDPEKEHVTLGFHNRKKEFNLQNYKSNLDYSNLRWTVDYPEDLEFIRKVYSKFQDRMNLFGFYEVLNLIRENPGMQSIIPASLRNEAFPKIVN
jgi:spore coat polysaccharide biosynthesis protein SpsF